MIVSAHKVAQSVRDMIPRSRRPHPKGGWVGIKTKSGLMALYSSDGRLNAIFDESLEVDLEIPDGDVPICASDLRAAPGDPIDSDSLGVTYFVGGDAGAVKIGRSTNLPVRLKDIQAFCPIPVRVLATRQGGGREKLYHRRFATYRLHGEWFERCPEIEAEIERLNSIPASGVERVL